MIGETFDSYYKKGKKLLYFGQTPPSFGFQQGAGSRTRLDSDFLICSQIRLLPAQTNCLDNSKKIYVSQVV
jgi:hypothetical protein